MKALPTTPRRFLTLDALFARRRQTQGEAGQAQPTRRPDDAGAPMLQDLACTPATQLGRVAAEVALQEGACRQYAARAESQVVDARRERERGRG